ncbi:MAG: DegV family protein [Eggerthellaceae bacterium]|nr:DegV family protein [Eggerthellaceae bacterium]
MTAQDQTYVIFADSACDLEPEVLTSWEIPWCGLSCSSNGILQTGFDGEAGIKSFFQRMRDGEVFKTSAVTIGEFSEGFSEVLAEGKDILYLGFSSGLSATVESAAQAADLLKEQYPDRRILIVDTLCASAGYGLILYLACQKRDAGATIDEVRDYAEDIKLNITHLFTVDDLVYLRRGGRVSGASATIATALNIKPVLHVDDEGKLVGISKAHGRKKALMAIATRYGNLAKHPSTGPVFISHGDCIDDVNMLAAMLNEKYGVGVDLVSYVGPVIGAHSGPGTLALFFEGKQR